MTTIQATIPEPYEDVRSLRASVMALKELVEVLAGQRGRDDQAVTWGELPPLPRTGDSGWNPLPYINGWTNYGPPFSPCGFRKLSSGLVILKGLVGNGTAAGICNLPPGYRPGVQLLLVAATAAAGGTCRLDIQTDGYLYHTSGSNAWLSLNNICFLAEG